MLPSAPAALVDPDGQVLFGTFAGAVSDTSFRHLRSVTAWRRALGQKRWIYLGVYSPELIVGGCVVDLTYLASGFAFALDRTCGSLLDHHRIGPRLRRAVPDTPLDGEARFSVPGATLMIRSDAAAGRRHLQARMGRGAELLTLDLEVADDGQRVVPLTAVMPLGQGLLNSTVKVAGLPASGTVGIGQRTIQVREALAAVDYSHSLPRYRTSWLWASGAGRCSDGRVLGLNLVSGWSDSASAENAAWLDGQLVKLGPATFTKNHSIWTVSCDGLTLSFTPEARRQQEVDLKVIASHYIQPLGRFAGELTAFGETVRFENLPGIAEDHHAVW